MNSARCLYCDADLRPNTAYCHECGQLASPPRELIAASDVVQRVISGSAPHVPSTPLPEPVKVDAAAAPELPAQRAEPPRHVPVSSLSLVFGTGERATVSGVAIIGRGPQQAAQNAGAQPVMVSDATKSVSRVHVTLRIDAGRATVEDAGSANGTRIERQGRSIVVVEGRPAEVQPGDRVWLGDIPADLS